MLVKFRLTIPTVTSNAISRIPKVTRLATPTCPDMDGVATTLSAGSRSTLPSDIPLTFRRSPTARLWCTTVVVVAVTVRSTLVMYA